MASGRDRKDKLSGMLDGAGPTERMAPVAERVAPAQVAAVRILLYVPPPAQAAPYLNVLQSEGLDVLLATSPEAAGVLLDGSRPSMIFAVVPILGDELRRMFREKAPTAELRVIASISRILDDWICPPSDAIEFALRAISSLAGALSSAVGAPRGRVARLLKLTEGAAESLGLTAESRAAARLVAILFDVPNAIAPVEARETRARGDVADDNVALLRGLVDGMRPPFEVAITPSEGTQPSAGEIVAAAAAYCDLTEREAVAPDVELRKRAGLGKLNASSVEAVLAAAGTGRAHPRGSIILVEPDSGTRNLLALRLINEGYDVRGFDNGRAALDSIRKDPPSVVLAETVLPGLDGFALLDTMKREGLGRIPLMFLAARADALAVNKGLLLGAADVLAKPVNTEVLLTKIQQLLGRAFVASDAAARLSLSDLTLQTATDYPLVTYDDLEPGLEVMGRFRIESSLGEGGMGKVFRARDTRLEETVVLKVMKDTFLAQSPKMLEHFKREIRLARKISHRGVVRIFDFFEAGPLKFVTMEWLEGWDLLAEIHQRGPLPVPIAVRTAIEIFEALESAHHVGVVHRDIKSQNNYRLRNGHVKILDFGISQGLEADAPDGKPITAAVLGTPAYMSPEQILGERLDARTDLYSAGIVLYEMLTGQLPFRGKELAETVSMHLRTTALPPSQSNAKIGTALDQIVLKLMSKSRGDRYPSAQAVSQALSMVTAGV